jgi:hypothetical protein
MCWPNLVVSGWVLLALSDVFLLLLQVSLSDICSLLQHVPEGVRARGDKEPLMHNPVCQAWAEEAPRVWHLIEEDIDRRVHSASCATVFLPAHFSSLLEGLARHGTNCKALWSEVANIAGHKLVSAPWLWPTRHLVRALVATATAQLPAHGLFQSSAEEVVRRIAPVRSLHPPQNSDACTTRLAGKLPLGATVRSNLDSTFGHHHIIGGVAVGLTFDEMENVLWAFAVMRRTYPYTTKRVFRSAAMRIETALKESRTLSKNASAVNLEALAGMLFTFAAASFTPRALFVVARGAVDRTDVPLSSEAVEAMLWAFQRAGYSPPQRCLDLSCSL